MKMKKLKEILYKQPHKVVEVEDGKDVHLGTVMVGIRYAEGERNYTYLVTPFNLKNIKDLKKHTFEKFTDAGIPIFQTPAFVQLEAS